MKLDLYLELSISGTQNVIHSFILIHCPQYSLPTARADSSSAKIKKKKKKRLHMKICDILERRTQIFTLFNTNFRALYLNPFGIAAMCWKAVTLFTGLRFSGWANEKWEFSPWQCACSTVWSPCFFCFLTSYQCLLPIAAHIFLEWSVKAKQGRGLEKSLWSQGAAEPLSSCHFQPVV